MNLIIIAALFCNFTPIAQIPTHLDWINLTQKPYKNSIIPDIGLTPLLNPSIRTKEQWNTRKTELKEQWMNKIGVFPNKPDSLATKIERTETLTNHKRILLSFQSDKNDRIQAYLLVPNSITQASKNPAVVVFHQTTKDTIKEPVGLGPNQSLAIANHLVRRGYIVLAPECFIMKGKGPQAQAIELAKSSPELTGIGKMTFDSSRCIDFLETHENVDPSKIGCIGFSLGAKEVLYAMAFEPRYKVGVFNEGGIGIRMSNWTDPWYLTSKMKANIPAMEHHQVLALIAPRPILIMGGNSADGDSSWPFIHATLPVYRLFDAEEKIGLINHKGKHSFPDSARETAHQWLDHWLDNKAIKDAAIPK